MQSTMEASARMTQVAPILLEIARMVPALAPDAQALGVRLASRVQGQQAPPGPSSGGSLSPSGPMAGGAPPMSPGSPAAGLPPPPPGAGAAPPPEAMSPLSVPGVAAGIDGGIGMAPPAGPPIPNTTSSGLMGYVQQAEVMLPQIAAADPSVAPDIQFFVARMREEVPKVVRGERSGFNPPPTDEMLQSLPVTA